MLLFIRRNMLTLENITKTANKKWHYINKAISSILITALLSTSALVFSPLPVAMAAVSGDTAGGALIVSGQTYTATNTSYSSITVQSGGTLNLPGNTTITVSGNVLATGNSSIIPLGSGASPSGRGVTLNAANVQVDVGSKIDASGKGYGYPDNGPGSVGNSQGGGGGGYGAAGGAGSSAGGGGAYGSSSAPVDLGSGGANYGVPGGRGGGAIKIVASGTVTNNGQILANGASGGTYSWTETTGDYKSGYTTTTYTAGTGGGSGGSVWIDAGGIMGSGSISAIGGNGVTGQNYNGGGGGGGRLAINAGSGSFSGPISTAGGSGVATGGTGTTYISGGFSFSGSLTTGTGSSISGTTVSLGTGQTISASGNLALTNASINMSGGTFNAASNTTAGTISALTMNSGTLNVGGALTITSSLTITGSSLTLGNNLQFSGSTLTMSGGTFNTGTGANISGTLNITGGTIDIGAGSTIGNSSSNISGAVLTINKNSTVNASNITINQNSTIYGNTTVNVANLFKVTSSKTLTLASDGVASPNGKGVTINAGDVQVDVGSYISTNGQGYAAASGSGVGASAEGAGGGGYGAVGGAGASGAGGGTYGSASAPIDLGSGGGGYGTAAGGAGGGAIKFVVSGNFTNNGSITANAAAGSSYNYSVEIIDGYDAKGNPITHMEARTAGSGGGSGGSIWIDTGGLIGAGTIAANGGNGVSGLSYSSGGGGGGRIAVFYSNKTSWSGTIQSNGGAIGNAAGGNNSVYMPPAKPSKPTPPTDSVGENAITWRWQESEATDATGGFKIYAGVHSGSETLLASVNGGAARTGSNYFTWTDTRSLNKNTQYSVHVHAVGGGATSGGSDTLSAYTAIEQPTGSAASFSNVAATSMNVAATNSSFSNLSSGGIKFDLYEGSAISGTPAFTSGWLTANAHSFTGLTPNTQYRLDIKTKNGDATERQLDSGNSLTKRTLANVPGAPAASAVSTNSINVPIALNSNPVATEFVIQEVGSGYYVNKSTGVLQPTADWGTYTEFGALAGKDVSGLSANTQYIFKVKARNADGIETAFGATTAKYTKPNLPGSISANAPSTDQVDVSWTAPAVGGADHYHVYSSTNNYGAIKYDGPLTNYSQVSLSPNTQYTYRVYAVNADNVESASYSTISRYTLASVPSITSDKNSTDWYGPDSFFTFSDNSALTNGVVGYYLYAFDTFETHTWTGLEERWDNINTALILPAPSQTGQYYLHIKPYNLEDIPSPELRLGYYKVDLDDPSTVDWVTGGGDGYADGYTNDTNRLEWNAATDALSGIRGYNVYRTTTSYEGNTYTINNLPASPSFDTTALNGETLITDISQPYQDTSLEAYRWYGYKVRAYDNALPGGNNSESSIIWVRTRRATQPVSASNVTLSTPDGDPTTDPTVGHQITISINGGASRNDTIDKYEVYRATSASGPWTSLVGTITRNAISTPGLINGLEFYDDETTASLSYTDTGSDVSSEGLNSSTRYYYKIRTVVSDEEGTYDVWTSATSVITNDITAPPDTSEVEVTDIASNVPGGTRRLIVSWPRINEAGNDFNQYRLYKSVNGVSWSYVTALGNNYFLDPDTSGQAYFYKVTTTDDANHSGNDSLDNESGGAVSSSINPAAIDRVAPALINPESLVTNLNANSATVTPSFDEASDAIVEVGTSSGNYTTISGNPTRGTSPSIVIRKLRPSTTYHYRVIARDASSNKLTSSDYTFTTPEFAVSSVSESVSVTGATIKWTANATADSFVRYTNAKTNEVNMVANNEAKDASAEHSLALKGLADGTQYSYQIVSKDEYANEATKAGSFTTDDFKVTDVNVDTTASTATITWKTNIAGNCFIEFGDQTVNEDETGMRHETKDHKMVLEGLKPGTKYKFRAVTRDTFGNEAASGELTFETKPFEITDVKTDTATNSAVIMWKTNLSSDSTVEYSANGEKESKTAGDATLTKEHAVTIKDLKSATTYTFKLKSQDADTNVAESEGLATFTTKSTNSGISVKPSASKVNEQELTATSAKIAWQTAAATSSWVEYGFTTSYGKMAGNDTPTIDHIVTLEGLTPGKTYHYRVKGIDIDGNEYVSADSTFTALVVPKLTSSAKVSVTNNGAAIVWATNTNTDSIVEYGLTNKYGDSNGSGVLTKVHSIEVKELVQNTTYHYRVGGVDKFGNKILGNDFTFKTLKDTAGPKLSEIRSEILRSSDETGNEKISVIVNFTTDEEATSYVEYAEGISLASYNKKTRQNPTLNLSHSTLIEGLKPATTYHYRIVTKDRYGNVTKSPDKTVLTPKESESVLQKIIKVLEETFGWISNLRDYLQGKV